MGARSTSFYTPQRVQIRDISGFYVDINKPKPYKHCFSGESEYHTYQLTNQQLFELNTLKTSRVHVIVGSRKATIPLHIQKWLAKQNVKEIVLFAIDTKYLVPFQLLVESKKQC